MFSKIQNLFSKKNPSTETTLNDTFDHSRVSPEDAAQCPFMKNKSKVQESEAKCPVTGKENAKAEVDSDSEEQKPKGGCPFMSGTSDKKKNPNLKLSESGFDEPFVSKFKFYLSSSKIDFSNIKRGLPQPTIVRDVFNNYPIYLQHTLFFNGEDYKKVRSLECCSRFMAYEQLREKGNKFYNKGKYYESLEYYERAMSLFRWIEYCEPANDSTISSTNHLDNDHSIDESSDNGSRVNIALGEEQNNSEDPNAAFDELKSKYKEFFITYTDDNTKLYDGEDLVEDADLDMRKSLLIQVYLNMCAAYINTHHYSLAEQICDDGINLSDKVSQLYFRKAQALALRKDSSLQQLQKAKELINFAIERRSNEKIFATANQNILKMLNLHDAAEAYEACRQIIDEKIAEKSAVINLNYDKIYNRVKEIHENELRIIAEGKVPRESKDDKILGNTTEMKILNRMLAKYVKVIEFYTEAKNSEQVNLAKKEFQETLRIKSEVNDLFSITLEAKEEGELGDLNSEKIQNRIAYVKTYFAEQLYNHGKFNFTMLEWVIKEIVKEEQQEKKAKIQAEKKAKEEQEAAFNEANPSISTSTKGFKYSNLLYALIFIPLIVMVLNMFVL